MTLCSIFFQILVSAVNYQDIKFSVQCTKNRTILNIRKMSAMNVLFQGKHFYTA